MANRCFETVFVILCNLGMSVFLVFFSPSIASADDEAINALKSQVVSAMKRFEKGEIEQAAKELPPYANEVLREYFPANLLRTFDEYQAKAKTNFGEALGDVSLVREEASGNSYCRLTFADRYTNGAMALQWVFYRTETDWKTTNFTYTPLDQILQADDPYVANVEPEARVVPELIATAFSHDRNSEGIMIAIKHGTPNVAIGFPEKVREQLNIKLKSESATGNTPLNQLDLLKTEAAGPSLVRLSYAIRRKQYPFYVQVIMYKGNDSWKPAAFNISSDTPPTFVAKQPTTEPVAR